MVWSADLGLLRVAAPAVGQAPALGDVAVDHLPRRSERPLLSGLSIVTGVSEADDETVLERRLSLERCGKRAMALSISCQDSTYASLDVRAGGLMGKIDGLGMAPEIKGWAASHHAQMGHGGDIRLPLAPHLLAQSKTGSVLPLNGARLDRHRAADVLVAIAISSAEKPRCFRIEKCQSWSCSSVMRGLLTEGFSSVTGEGEADLKSLGREASIFATTSSVNPFALSVSS